jgi:hypothetical protein
MTYVGDYFFKDIKGISNNEIYLFGVQALGNVTIIKWNGSSFEYYPTLYTASNLGIKGCIVNSNEIWVLSQGGISRFDGVRMIDYHYENPFSFPIDFFLTIDNNLQYITEEYNDTVSIKQNLYEFRDTGFVKIYNDFTKYLYLRQAGGYKIGVELNYDLDRVCIHNFTGSSFINYFCYNNKIVYDWYSQSNNPEGPNLQNFIFLAQASTPIFNIPHEENPNKVGILHWDGNKVSKEIGLYSAGSTFPYDGYILYAINKDNYLILEPFSPNWYNSRLYIGTKK